MSRTHKPVSADPDTRFQQNLTKRIHIVSGGSCHSQDSVSSTDTANYVLPTLLLLSRIVFNGSIIHHPV